MRRLVLAMALLAFAGCDSSPNATPEREVQAAVAAFKPPARPAFPSLNAETIDRLSRDVPELARHRAAIEAADKAVLARAAAELGRRDPPGAAAGPVAARFAPGRPPRPPIDVAGWIVPAAHAQSIDLSAITALTSGNAAAMLLGGVANVPGEAGKSGSRTETIRGSNGEKATLGIARDAEGRVTTSIESNVDIPPLGLTAGARTTLIGKGLCPDPSGRVEFTIRQSQKGEAGSGGAATFDSQLEAHVVLSVDDNAAIVEQDIRTSYSRKSSGRSGGISYEGQTDWHRTGDGGYEVAGNRPGKRSGAVTEAMETSAMVAATSLAIGAIVGAESKWNDGSCIRIDAKSPGRVDPKAKSSIPVAVLSKIDDGAVAAKVTATLSGGESIDPAEIARTPGTIVHTAPDAKKARMTIQLTAVSRRGKATAKLDLLVSEGAYGIEGGAGEFHGTGTICDIAKPFTVEGSGVTVTFTPSSERGGRYSYRGSISGFRLSGTGTYTVRYNGDVATAIVATGPGSVATSAGTVHGSGDEQYELMPVHNYNCE